MKFRIQLFLIMGGEPPPHGGEPPPHMGGSPPLHMGAPHRGGSPPPPQRCLVFIIFDTLLRSHSSGKGAVRIYMKFCIFWWHYRLERMEFDGFHKGVKSAYVTLPYVTLPYVTIPRKT